MLLQPQVPGLVLELDTLLADPNASMAAVHQLVAKMRQALRRLAGMQQS